MDFHFCIFVASFFRKSKTGLVITNRICHNELKKSYLNYCIMDLSKIITMLTGNKMVGEIFST